MKPANLRTPRASVVGVCQLRMNGFEMANGGEADFDANFDNGFSGNFQTVAK